MALNFNNPVTSDTRAAVLQFIRDHQVAFAKMLDGETLTGQPTGTIRYSTANGFFERFNGTVWAQLSQPYLPLGGGTLSGALTGTSANFTSSLQVNGNAVWHAGNLTPGNYQLASTAWNTGNFNPATKQDAATAWNTGNFNPALKQDAATAWNTGNFDPSTKANVSGQAFSGNVSAPQVSAPAMRATGAAAITQFEQRDATGTVWGWYATGGIAYLWNGAANRFQVDSSGNVQTTGLLNVGASANVQFQTNGNGTLAGTLNVAGLGTFSNGLNVTGAITASGNITAFSDRRLKKNIQGYHLSVDEMLSMGLHTYEMFGMKSAGVIAQDVDAVAPLFVSHAEYLSVDYGRLSFAMVASLLRELRARQVI